MTETSLDTASRPTTTTRGIPPWVRGFIVFFALFLFISAVKMIGGGQKVVAQDKSGDDFLKWIFTMVEDPMTGLLIGVLVTSLVQSSSFTTSFVVGLVATSSGVSLHAAVPIIMGANIGTSVTNILVSLANVRHREEFRLSLGGAIVHDFFNVLSVMLFLPLEYAFGVISKPMDMVAKYLATTNMFQTNPSDKIGFIKGAFGALAKLAKWVLVDVFSISKPVAGAIIAALALILLFVALWLLVKMLRGLMQQRLAGAFDRTIFRNPAIAFVVGIILTASVQSSSVTTSLVVPLVGAGILQLRQIYPYTLGANIGTTITAMLAAIALGRPEGMACACGHLLFNIYGTAVFWPLQFIPISLAKGFAKLASRRRLIAAFYIIGFFFLLPASIIAIKNGLLTIIMNWFV